MGDIHLSAFAQNLAWGFFTKDHATNPGKLDIAVVEATVSRVRPVLMASLTTIVGMIPLVGDPMYGSMAITIMGGLTVGTIITLILLPLFYTALFHIRKPKEEVQA